MVHQWLVLELTVKSPMVSQSIPRFYAYERCILAKRTPEGTDGCFVVNGDSRFAIGIQQHGTMGLALVNLHTIVAEETLGNFQDAHISIHRYVYQVV